MTRLMMIMMAGVVVVVVVVVGEYVSKHPEEVLIEGDSRKSDKHWMGRNSQNTVVVFPKEHYKAGEFVMVRIEDCTSATLLGTAVGYSDNRKAW